MPENKTFHVVVLGAGFGGVALSFGGYSLLGATLATLFALGAAPHLAAVLADRAASRGRTGFERPSCEFGSVFPTVRSINASCPRHGRPRRKSPLPL